MTSCVGERGPVHIQIGLDFRLRLLYSTKLVCMVDP